MFAMGVVDLLTVLMLDIYFRILEKGGKHNVEIVPLGRIPIIVCRDT